jgi:hypothetical protein
MKCGDDWNLHTSYPAFEDGTDRWFRNVGIQKLDTGDTPKRLLTIFKTQLKFAIKKNVFVYSLELTPAFLYL